MSGQLDGKVALVTGAVRAMFDEVAAIPHMLKNGSGFITGHTLHVNGGQFLP